MSTHPIWFLVFVGLFLGSGCTSYHQGPPGTSRDTMTQAVVPEVKQLVEENIKDPDKASKVQAMIQDIVKEVRKSNQQVRGYHEQLAMLNTDYNAKPEQFTKILDELNNSRMQAASNILGMRFKIKDMLTAEEWKNLNDAMMKSRQEHEMRPTGRSGASWRDAGRAGVMGSMHRGTQARNAATTGQTRS
jgi:hypothetical protein